MSEGNFSKREEISSQLAPGTFGWGGYLGETGNFLGHGKTGERGHLGE